MIKLKGPTKAEAGTTVCLTASNVGLGFSAVGVTGVTPLNLTVKIDPKSHTATICFTAPPKGELIVVFVTDSSGNRGTDHTTLSM
ncbi:MAG: hypothetical protein ACI97A_003690 [Planctomycetota bacterium]|jgi:hypothetical protein